MTITKSLVNSLTQQAATLALTEHVDPSDAIIKVINSMPDLVAQLHTPVVQNLIKRVTTATNKTVWLSLYAKLPDKTFSFNVADADAIIHQLLKQHGLSTVKAVSFNPEYAASEYDITEDDMPALSAAENELIFHQGLQDDAWDIEDNISQDLHSLEEALLTNDEKKLQSVLTAPNQPSESKEDNPINQYPPVMHKYLIVVDGRVKPNINAISRLLLNLKQQHDNSAIRDQSMTDLIKQIMDIIKHSISGGANPDILAKKVALASESDISLDTLKQIISNATLGLKSSTKEAAKYDPDPGHVQKIASLLDSMVELKSLKKTASYFDTEVLDVLMHEFPQIRPLVNSYLGGL